jgi:hypothetical protein
MKALLLSIVKSPAVRKAAVALAVAIATALGFSQFGCKDLTPKQQARLDRFECQVAAVAPIVEPLYDAAELVLKLRSGEASLSQVLQSLEAGEPEVRALIARLDACSDAPEIEPAALTPASW